MVLKDILQVFKNCMPKNYKQNVTFQTNIKISLIYFKNSIICSEAK